MGRGVAGSVRPRRQASAWALGASLTLSASPGCVSALHDDARAPGATESATESATAWKLRALEAEVALRDTRIRELEATLRLKEAEAKNRELEGRLALAGREPEDLGAPPARGSWEAAEIEGLSAEGRLRSGRELVRRVQALIEAGVVRAQVHEGRLALVVLAPLDGPDPWLPGGAGGEVRAIGARRAELRAHGPAVRRVQALADAGVVRARMLRGRVTLTMPEVALRGDPWRNERR